MIESAAQANRSDVRKTALLVLLVLVLFGSFFWAFPERKALHSFLLEDPGGRMAVRDVLAAPADAWVDSQGRTANAGYTDSTYWIRTQLPDWGGASGCWSSTFHSSSPSTSTACKQAAS